MSETNALSLTQETDLEKTLGEGVRNHLSERPEGRCAQMDPDPLSAQLAITAAASAEIPDGDELYERGTTLKNVGLFKQAAEHFEKAAQDPPFALKGLAQMGLCLKKSGQQEEAVEAFRKALQVPSASSKEQVQILYLLGRTLESLGRMAEAVEAYRWLRREAPEYRDVALRIESLSTRRVAKQF